jgi:hypothetical protein
LKPILEVLLLALDRLIGLMRDTVKDLSDDEFMREVMNLIDLLKTIENIVI